MTLSDIQSPGSALTHDSQAASACDACGHDLSSHDATSARFCRATTDRALDRACICFPRENVTADRSGTPMYGRGRYSGR
jgi:hypothetical protein